VEYFHFLDKIVLPSETQIEYIITAPQPAAA